LSKVLPRTYIIGIIVFCFIIVAGISLLANFGINNSQVTDFNKSFQKYDEVLEVSSSLRSSVEDADTDFGPFGILNTLISSAWQSLKLLFTSLGFMNDAYAAVSSFFGVPAWIPALLVSAVVIVLLFSIWSAVFQRDL